MGKSACRKCLGLIIMPRDHSRKGSRKIMAPGGRANRIHVQVLTKYPSSASTEMTTIGPNAKIILRCTRSAWLSGKKRKGQGEGGRAAEFLCAARSTHVGDVTAAYGSELRAHSFAGAGNDHWAVKRCVCIATSGCKEESLPLVTGLCSACDDILPQTIAPQTHSNLPFI